VDWQAVGVKGRFLVAGLVPLVSIIPATAISQGRAPDCPFSPAVTLTQRPWSAERLDFARVWPLTTGSGVVVAVLDTGVDAAHPQLAGRVLAGSDMVRTGSANTDCHGHGTFVAGIIAAGQISGVPFTGVAPGATVLPIREADSTGSAPVSNLARGIRVAADLGARIINVSVVTSANDASLHDAVRYAVGRGAVVVAAAGNDFGNGDPHQYPASFPEVLAVGAIDANGARAAFSDTGAIGVVAPGTDLVSIGAGGAGLVAGSGTSYAAPFVSGVAALVAAYHPELTPAQIIHRIEVTADHPPGRLPDPSLGWGVVNPYEAVTAILPEERGGDVTMPSPSPVAMAEHARSDAGGAPAAWLATLTFAIAAAAVIGARVVAAGRRRDWRPGGGGD
jgi:type VII secretion-associated serine protease mycosin